MFFFVLERVGVAAGVGKSSKGASAMVRLAESLRVVNGKLSGEWRVSDTPHNTAIICLS